MKRVSLENSDLMRVLGLNLYYPHMLSRKPQEKELGKTILV